MEYHQCNMVSVSLVFYLCQAFKNWFKTLYNVLFYLYQIKGKVFQSLVAHTVGAFPVFRSMKRLGVLLLLQFQHLPVSFPANKFMETGNESAFDAG